jgi:hypothetical protein
MKMRGVRACLNRWGEYTEERQLCRRVMAKVIGRYTKQGILGGWNRWREVRVLLLLLLLLSLAIINAKLVLTVANRTAQNLNLLGLVLPVVVQLEGVHAFRPGGERGT